tara:strand:- start:5244 stop:5612 length:369 start_codon:yes stop_codon:yes gene_type:complete
MRKINKELIENIEMVRTPIVEDHFKFVKQPIRIRVFNFLRGIKSRTRIRCGSWELLFNCYLNIGDLNRDSYFIKKGVVYQRPHIVVKMSSGDDYTKHFITLKDMDKWLYDNVGDLKLITILP